MTRYLSDIVGGAISADLLDYLRRDTYFCGLSQYYDQRVFESFVIDNNRLVMNLEKNGMLRRDALSELVNLLRIRYTLSERVYFPSHQDRFGRHDLQSCGTCA